MALSLIINGQPREFPTLDALATVTQLVSVMELKGDRVAIEVNREIASRTQWDEVRLRPDDRLEIVHFVGGGLDRNLHGQCPITDILYS